MLRYMYRFLAIIFALVCSYLSSAQRYIESDFGKKVKFENILNVSGVRCLQDSKGFLWITTNDGIRRYDGYSFKVFKNEKSNKNSLNVNPLQGLCESKDGLIWIGTVGGGVNIYDPKQETFEHMVMDSLNTNSLSSNLVYAVCEDVDGTMWFGTFGGGVCRYNREKKEFKRYLPEANNHFSLSGKDVRDIVLDKNKQVWIGVDGGGLCRYERSSNRFIRHMSEPGDPSTLASNIVLDIFVDKDGFFWTGSWEGGVTKFDPNTGKAVARYKNDPANPNSLANNISFGISQDPQGRIWISTWKGLDVLDQKTGIFHHFVHDPLEPTSLPNNMMFDAFCDKFGCMWVHTASGTCKINMLQKRFSVFEHDLTNKNSLNSSDVGVIAKMPNGEYWIASQNNGINIVDFEQNAFKVLTSIPGDKNSPLSNTRPTAIYLDINGWVWLSTTSGVDVYNPQTMRKIASHVQIPHKDSLQNNVCNAILNDRNGDLWFTTYGGGVFRYNYKSKKFKNYPIDASTQMNNVGIHMTIDAEGVIWVATKNFGLAYFDPKSDGLKFIMNDEKNKKSLSTNNLQYVYEDQNGILWLGSAGNGFDRYDRKTQEFQNFNKKNAGIADDIVNSIISQGRHLWVATNSGITKFDMEKLVTVQNFDQSDGLAGTGFTERSVFRNEHDLLFFGSSKGLTIFHPDSITNNPAPPKVVLTELKLNNFLVVPGKGQPITENIGSAKEIHLSYLKHKNVYIEFTVLHFTNPGKNQYKYMLEGFDTSWTITSVDRRFAQYTNLSGGEYTFKVIGASCDGVWDNDGASVKIIVHPPFYMTIWFYIMIALVILAVFYYIMKQREKRALKEKLHMQKKIDEAVSNVEEQKKEILKQNDELQKSREVEKQRQWFNEGIAKFSDILRKHKDKVDELATIILQNVVRHIDASQGGIYLLNEEDSSNVFLELQASYAYDSKKFGMRKVQIGETLVGNCFKDGVTKHFKQLPDDYLSVSSGLGEGQANELLLIPLKVEEVIIGVMELASFCGFTTVQVEFLEKLSENVTSQLYNTKMSAKTNKLLEKSQRMAEEMQLREIQINQHIQELETNKEEALRLKKESDEFINSVNNSVMRADFDTRGMLVYSNEIFNGILQVTDYQARRMHFTDCVAPEQQVLYNEFWPTLVESQSHVQHTFAYVADGRQQEFITVLMPVKDLYGQVNKILLLAVSR